jgi:iron complex outermembrane receptor protein/outer membrane receptor for ferrienterochelin and colicins
VNYRSSNRNSGNNNKYDDYTMVDVGVRYQLNKHTQLMAGVYNVLDEDPKLTTAWSESAQVEGRRYNLGARVEF